MSEQAIEVTKIETTPSGALRFVTLSSGATVTVKRINLNVANRVMDSVPRPPAPVMEVERPDGTRETVENTLDPSYQRQLSRYENARLMKLISFAAGLYVRLWNAGAHGLSEAQSDELATLEAAMREETGSELDGRDPEARYITNCAFAAADDYTLVMNALFAQADNPKS